MRFRARVVLLGASNLTRALATVIETCRGLLGAPLDIQVVAGHGRSYGIDSFVLVRSLPGILESSLWRELEHCEPLPTYGLITDVGNDIMYGVAPERIADWVGACIERLQGPHAQAPRLVLTRLPLARLEHLGPAHYRIMRALFFPGRPLSQAQARERAVRLDHRLHEIALERRVALVENPAHWYGFDPIHVRRAAWAEAWATMLGPWRDSPPPLLQRPSLARWLALHTRSPDRWSLLGRIPRGRPQPCLHLEDGTTVSLR